MSRRVPLLIVTALICLCWTPRASADIAEVARCQKKLANAGASFAKRVIKATLKCTQEIAECQVQCEEGVFGFPCDPEDRESNAAFGECMDDADEQCAKQTAKIANWEEKKQNKIIKACDDLTQEELCGSTGNGLNFETLNAGCSALDPNYVCDIDSLIGCLGGPLQRDLVDQISGLLDPRASSAIAAGNLQSAFPGIAVARKVQGQVPAGKRDVWSISGQAGDKIAGRVKTLPDGVGTPSGLSPSLVLLGNDGTTPLSETEISPASCGTPSTCGATCQQVARRLPFSGTYFFAVEGNNDPGCAGGSYRLVIVSPGGVAPVLVADDVDP